MRAFLLLCLACTAPEPADAGPTAIVAPAPWVPPPPEAAGPIRDGYRGRSAALEQTRVALAAELAADPAARADVLARATDVLGHALVGALIPAWYGTPWAFYGTSERPGQGTIACGYFVSTVLRDAGFRLERVKLAQQAAEHIIQTLIPEPHVRRFRAGRLDVVVDAVIGDGPGVFIVGLDNHVGLLIGDGADLWFCHASYLEPVAMLCEPAREAPAMASRYHVVGRLLGPETVERWLRGEAFPTRTR